MDTTGTIIGITEQRLYDIVHEAAYNGYQQGRTDMQQELEDSQWLNSRMEIIKYISPEKHISIETFNRHRRNGVYGSAIVGIGSKCRARKDELNNAIKLYNISQI